MLKALDGDLQNLATELRAAQDAVANEVGDLTSQLIAAKLAAAEQEETIEGLRRELQADRAQKASAPGAEADATPDELRAILAAERLAFKTQLDDAHARLAEAAPLPLASPGAKKPSKLFLRAVTTTTMLKRRAKKAYTRKKVPKEQSVDQLLAGAPLFASLSLSERGDLADHCIVAEFRHGDVISSTGDYSDQMCLVARGAVILSVESTEVATVEPGGSFGDDSLMHDLKRSSTATAASDLVRLVCVPRRALRDILRGERDTRSLWDAYRSYEASLLKRLVQDVEAASTRQEYLLALGRHRATASLIPLEPTCKMLQRGGKDARRKQFVVDLRREASLILDGERYPLETEAHFDEFMAVLQGLAQRAATAPASTDAPDPLALPPSLVGFLPYAPPASNGAGTADYSRAQVALRRRRRERGQGGPGTTGRGPRSGRGHPAATAGVVLADDVRRRELCTVPRIVRLRRRRGPDALARTDLADADPRFKRRLGDAHVDEHLPRAACRRGNGRARHGLFHLVPAGDVGCGSPGSGERRRIGAPHVDFLLPPLGRVRY